MPSKWLTRVSPSRSISGHPLPASRLEPAEEDPRHAIAGLVGPEAIELLAQDVCFTQPPVGRKELRSFAPLRPSHGLPASQQQPALASTKGSHDGTCAKELLSPHVSCALEFSWTLDCERVLAGGVLR